VLAVWLDQPACRDIALTGGKAARLSQLADRYPVPPGFCLTAHAHSRWAGEGAPALLPVDLGALLDETYAALADRCGAARLRVAVRSSALGEDGAAASFAGQYSTHLNPAGLEAVADAVIACWASARAERVLAYQRSHGPSGGGEPVAVLVQQLVPADASFVAFSANPVTGERSEVVVDASLGLGESIVSGSVTPDTYTLRRSDRSIATWHVHDKQRMTILRPAGVQEVNVPRALRRRPALTETQASAVADLAVGLEADLGFPVDVEGAFHDDTLYLLQCRPISTLRP